MQYVLFVTTVEPLIYRAGLDAGALIFQDLKRRGNLELIFFPDILFDEVAERIAQFFTIPEVVDTHNSLVGDEVFGFFNEFPDIALFIRYHDTKSRRIIEPLNPDDTVLFHIKTEICLEKRIGQRHDTGTTQTVGGTGNGVTHPQRFVLIVNAAFGAEAFGNTNKLLFNIGSEIAYDVGNFFYFSGVRNCQILDETLNHGLSGYRDEGFGHRKCVRAQAGSPSCHRDDDFHIKNVVGLHTGTAESSAPATRVRKIFSFCPGNLLVPGNNHLSDALTGFDSLSFVGKVDYNAFDLSPVITVYSAGGIEHGKTAFGSQTTSGSDLRFITVRKFDEQSSRNERALERTEDNRFNDMRFQIHAGTATGFVTRQIVGRFIDDSDFQHCTFWAKVAILNLKTDLNSYLLPNLKKIQESLLFFRLKRAVLRMKLNFFLIFLLFALPISAQAPANDECSGAIALGDVPYCSNPAQFTNLGATTSNIDPQFNIPTCFINSSDRDVWFSFTMPAAGTFNDVVISVLGDIGGNGTLNMPQVALYRGDCSFGGLAELACASAPLNEAEVKLEFLGLIPGETYYLRVNDYSATGTPNWGTFRLCVEEYVPDFIMGQSPGTAKCSGTLRDSGGETGDYSGNENYSFTICPQEFHQCIIIRVEEYETENNFDILSIFEGQGTAGTEIAALDGNGSDKVFYVSDNCATITFESDNSVNFSGFHLNWLCTPDVCPAPPPVPPSASSCDAALTINGCDTELPNIITLEPGTGDPDFIVNGVNAGCILTPGINLNFTFFYFVAQSDGDFSFLVKNNDSANPSDIDFNVWGPIDSISQICNFVSNNQPVRSSWRLGPTTENPEGFTGLTAVNPYNGSPITDEFDCGSPATPGQGTLPTDDSFVRPLEVQQGKIYVVFMDDFSGAIESEGGISIDFSGTTPGVLSNTAESQVTVSSDTTVCPGELVQLNVTGGLAYAWDPSSLLSCNSCANPVATAAGEITYIVRVATTCRTIKDSVTIGYLELDLGPDAFVCEGASFELNSNPVQGTYSWAGSGLSCSDCPTPVFTASQAGASTVIATVTRPGCSASDTILINIANGQQPVANIIQDTVICAGESLNIGGVAVPGIQYQWVSDPQGFSSSVSNPPAVSPLVRTTYYVVASSNDCVFPSVDSVVVDVSRMPDISLVAPAIFCQGESVVLGNTTAQSGVSYSWTPADGTLSDPAVPNPVATPTIPGTHIYTLTASNTGCSTSSSVSVTSVGLDLNLAVPDRIFLCKGESGEIRVNVNPAGTPLVWSPFNELSFVSGDSVALVYPSDNQEYTITASLPGCSRSRKVSVRVDSLPPFLNLSPVDTTVCKGSQVIIRWPESDPLYEPGLFPDLTFQWSPGDYQVTPDSLPFLAVQPQDTVLYRRISINGACRDTAYAQVNATSPPEFVITPAVSTVCPDSSVLLTATALTPYDSLRWTPSTSLSCATCETPLATPSGSTTYTLTAEYNGCKASYNATVNVKPLPFYQFPDMPSMCSGDEIRLNETSDPTGTVYQWISVPPLPIPQVPEPTVTLGGIGLQTVKFIMNATNGCLVRDSFSVTYTGVTLTATGSDTICPRIQKVLTASATLGGGTYLWSNGATTQAILADPAVTTTYTVTYTINGCEYDDEVVLTVEGQTPEIVFPDDIALCPGDSIVLNSVETPGASYSWSATPPLQIDQTGTPSPVYPQQTTQFKVSAVLGDCAIEKTLNVVVLTATLTVTPDLKVCTGQPFTLNATGTSTGTYEWNPGNDEPSINDEFDTSKSVDYAILYTYGPPGNTCQISDTVNVSTYPAFSVEILADPDSILNAGDQIELDANIVPSQILDGFAFSWLENGVTPLGNTQQIAYTPETLDTSLYFDVKVTAPSGCMETATYKIRVVQPDVNIPNAFTPNGDSANDTFGLTIVEGKAVTERMEIFSRWGQLVYEDTNQAASWDGRVDNQDAPSDVYVYRIRWRRGDGSLVISTGQVTLIR